MSMGRQWSRFTTVLKFKYEQQNAYGRWGVKGLGWLPLSAHLLPSVPVPFYYCSLCWLAAKQVRSAGKTLQEERAAHSVRFHFLQPGPQAHLSRSWQLPPGSAQQRSASSITFSWEWSFPFFCGRIMQSHWSGTTTTQLAGKSSIQGMGALLGTISVSLHFTGKSIATLTPCQLIICHLCWSFLLHLLPPPHSPVFLPLIILPFSKLLRAKWKSQNLLCLPELTVYNNYQLPLSLILVSTELI